MAAAHQLHGFNQYQCHLLYLRNGFVDTNLHNDNPTDGTGLTLTHTQASPFAGVPLNSALATVSNETFSQIVTAYPNPFQDDFRFQINTASNETVQVAIYDLVGKCIELIKVDANQINDLQVGKNYPSGFYSLKVSQGDKNQSVRMIKK